MTRAPRVPKPGKAARRERATPDASSTPPALHKLPDDVLARAPEDGARLVALLLATRATEARRRLDDPTDATALHAFRVSMRRLRATLAAYKDSLRDSVGGKTRARLRTLARATGDGRDLEVQIAWIDRQRSHLYSRQRPGLGWLRTRLAAAKTEADAALARDVARKADRTLARLAKALPRYTRTVRVTLPGDAPAPAPRFAHTLAARLRDGAATLGEAMTELALRIDGGTLTDDRETTTLAHDARLAAKRVRYLLAPVATQVAGAAPAVERLRTLQDLLGELHDLDVLGTVLERATRDATRERDALTLAAADAARAADAASVASTSAASSAESNGAGDAGGTLDATSTASSPAGADGDGSAAARTAAPRLPDPRPGLAALGRRARARRDALAAELAATWVTGRTGLQLVADLDAVAAALDDAHAPPTVEIERKYLLRALPRVLRGAVFVEVEQGYLPGERLRERIRRVRQDGNERYLRTVKLGTGVARIEVEEATSAELFALLWPATRERRVTKRRYAVTDVGLTWEVDEFTDRPLVLAEVELPAADETVTPPPWLAPYVVRDVTDEPAYTNASLARPAADGAEGGGGAASAASAGM